jgi:YebC/PmpR family DNA-binding regulatory protein
MGAQWKQKHRVAAADAKGRLFGRLAKEIAIAARGGADPSMNAALRMAVEAARKQSMPRDTLERAIKKGAGLSGEVIHYESVTYEGFAPHQVAVIVECLTDNNNRTASNIRALFDKRGGQLGAQGSVSWDFNRCGLVVAQPGEGAGIDPEEAAIEAGADDVQPGDDGASQFITAPTELANVTRSLGERGWVTESSQLVWIPKNPVTLAGDTLTEVETFLVALDEDEDVQNLYTNLAD